MFDADRIYSLDIETDTSINGLDQRIAPITEISLSLESEDIVLAVPTPEDELAALRELDEILSDLPPGLITTWNGTFFDLPFLHDRQHLALGSDGSTRHLGLQLAPAPGREPKYDYLPGHSIGYSAVWHRAGQDVPHQHADVMWDYKQFATDNDVPWSLKPVCIANGIEMIEVDRMNMHLLTPAERRAYAASDTRGTRGLALPVYSR